MAPGRVRRVTGNARLGRRRFRGNAGMHHDLVDLGVVRPSYLPSQERLRDGDQAIGQIR